MSGLQLYHHLVPRALFPDFGGGLPGFPGKSTLGTRLTVSVKVVPWQNYIHSSHVEIQKITFAFPICTSHSLRSWSVIVFPAQTLLGHICLSWSKSVRIYIFLLIISGGKIFFCTPPSHTFQLMVHPCRRFYYCYEIIIFNSIFLDWYIEPHYLIWSAQHICELHSCAS